MHRIKIWEVIALETKKLIIFEKNTLNTQQRYRLWDNIGFENRLILWNTFDENLMSTMLTKMTTWQQVTLFMSFKNDPVSMKQKQL